MAITRPVYVNRDTIFGATDAEPSLRARQQADDGAQAATESVDGQLHRVFVPTIATRTFRWPDPARSTSWRLWLRQNDLATLTGLTSAGAAIPTASVFLEPGTGPPYTSLEIDTRTSSAFSAGQRSIAVSGTFCGQRLTTAPASTLAATVNDSVTTIAVAKSGYLAPGDLAIIGTEYLLITESAMVTTGQTLGTPVGDSAAEVALSVADGTAIAVGETLLLDSERMEVQDIAGNTLTVRRAVQGSVLASHTGSTIYAPRSYTVVRGAQGSTAAAHNSGSAVSRHVVTPLVQQLALAEALVYIANNGGAWARPAGSGANTAPAPGGGLDDLRRQVFAAHGRIRKEAV
jgi:hypothetical protein